MSNIRSGRLVRSLPNVEPPTKVDHGKKTIGYTRWTPKPVKVRLAFGTVTMSPEEFARWRIDVAQASTRLKSCRCPGKCQCG